MLAVLLLPIVLWKGAWFLLGRGAHADSGVDFDADLAQAERQGTSASLRLLNNDDDWVEGMEHGHDCKTADEMQDVREIKLRMVRKYHVTMGGVNNTGCASGVGPCLKPGTEWTMIMYLPGMFYMFIALALVCDDFFVPSLEMFVDHYGISMDVAGATFMAAGGSMPELFTSFFSVFGGDEMGFAAIVGSAVFNVLFVIAVCALSADEPLALTGWPLGRDCFFYVVALGLLVIFLIAEPQGQIELWEALLLFLWYICYCCFMKENQRVREWVTGKKAAAVSPAEEGTDDDDQSKDATKKRTAVDPRKPSSFRAGIIQLLTQHASITDTAGIMVVTELKNSLQEAFNAMDVDGDGCIDQSEFSNFLAELGWVHTDTKGNESTAENDPIAHAWRLMPLSGNGTVTFENFNRWYVSSTARVEIEVRRVFEALDQNGNGYLDADEIAQLLFNVGHRPQKKELAEVLEDIGRFAKEEEPTPSEASEGNEKLRVKYAQFEQWYKQSMFWEGHKNKNKMEKKVQEGFSIDWPEDPTNQQLFWYIFTYPLCSAMYCSLPDVRREGMQKKVKWAFVEFFLSLVWIGVFANALYECTLVISNTIGIPSTVSGITILAAGTSVPDLLSSYIVARQGEGDMAVSSSIGSNIFDVTVGLPVPWMLFCLVKNETVKVEAGAIGFNLILLIGMLTSVIITVKAMNWKMNKAMGYIMLFFYAIFLLIYLLQQFPSKESPYLDISF